MIVMNRHINIPDGFVDGSDDGITVGTRLGESIKQI